MKRKPTKKSSAAVFLSSPLPTASPDRSPRKSPKQQFEFNLGPFHTASSSKKKNASPYRSPSKSPKQQFEFNLGAFHTASSSKKKNDVPSSSVRIQNNGSPPNLKNLNTISDLKEVASSRLDSIKRQLDRSHAEILKDLEASHSRIHKRFKIQAQACQQVVEEADKEYKKISERVSETRDAMKASYMEYLAEAQASASRVCKTSIPELSQSFEKALDVLRNRYGISSAAM